MNKLPLLLILVALLTSCQGQPLKALLYCYLPAVNTQNKTQEYNRLATMVNQKLQANSINVVVEVCNSTTASKLYDADQISSLFDQYDIVEVDVSYLWAIKTDLLSFSMDEIDYENQVFKFQWVPVKRVINGESKYIGSPGLICSNFIETRVGQKYIDRLYADFGNQNGQYNLVTLYLSTYVNLKPLKTLRKFNYQVIDHPSIVQVAKFLADCQDNKDKFNYESNWCLNPGNQSFLETNYSKTIGYSENLFNFINSGVESQDILITNIAKSKPKKIFYADQFVAKNTEDIQTKKTILSFYKFMISREILSIYIQGTYTDKPHKTYLIPPTIDYLRELAINDKIYQSINQNAFNRDIHLPLYEPSFAKNVYSFATLITQALKQQSKKQE